jgi:hypothetical protein
MAVHDDTGKLVYIGNVGTGFTQRLLDELRTKLQPLQRKTPTVDADVKDSVWLEPRVVGEVSFTEWTSDGRLRHPSWRGLRPDKAPHKVVREPQTRSSGRADEPDSLPIHVLQRYAGHATPTMTMHYIAARDQHAEQALRPRLVTGPPRPSHARPPCGPRSRSVISRRTASAGGPDCRSRLSR